MKKQIDSTKLTATGKTKSVKLKAGDPGNMLATHKYVDEAIQRAREQSNALYWKRDDKLFPETGDGYQELPSGLILQWGFVKQPTPHPRGQTIEYPHPFSNEVFGVFTTGAQGDIRGAEQFNVVSHDRKSFSVYVLGKNTSDCFWFALGR